MLQADRRDRGFPADQYTPHGFLATPDAYARSWSSTGQGHGNLQSSFQHLGFGWALPWSRGARARVELVLACQAGDRVLATRAEFDAAGLSCPHHTSELMEYAWEVSGTGCRARFTRTGPEQLGMSLEAPRGRPADTTVWLALLASRTEGDATSVETGSGGWVDLGEHGRWSVRTDGLCVVDHRSTLPPAIRDALANAVRVWQWDPEKRSTAAAVLGRDEPSGAMPATLGQDGGPDVGRAVAQGVERALAADEGFWRTAARLEGDWPDSWRRGFVYDMETTRMCVYPAGGIFQDIWPSWMIQWPRAVIAEGSLDMLRLCYASPDLAKRALLSLFRDAPSRNVPCVFKHGEPNMVARDGAVCGTSPAWCVPFHNILAVYRATLDRAWLALIYPYLTRYVEWWLEHRRDPGGWVVYKCTWEAGEDDTPRLDPERRGDTVVSDFVRPVELQASMAMAAEALAVFATDLGYRADVDRWHALAADFGVKTRALWDTGAGRFRDFDRRTGEFLAPAETSNYWGVDPCRFSALAFAPFLTGLVTAEQRRAIRTELGHYMSPPWTLWASWSWVVTEAAAAAGHPDLAARITHQIIQRVYPQLDARERRRDGPTPGVAREYWPLDLEGWSACDGYGWGANTAMLLIRNIVGFRESPRTDGFSFELTPRLPPKLLQSGRQYAFINLPYRGSLLDIRYTVGARAHTLIAEISRVGESKVQHRTMRISAGKPTRIELE
ncbi:MAG: hypothetical protein U0821_09700 [Chloroflexota bacterium]